MALTRPQVLTGFEWNKYNQTHYDADNPPPKVVQGYKVRYRALLGATTDEAQFNIFLPDLIDKTKAPQFKIIKDKDDEDTALLVFKCGPPYEDLAFRIVNKEWECVHALRAKGVILTTRQVLAQAWLPLQLRPGRLAALGVIQVRARPDVKRSRSSPSQAHSVPQVAGVTLSVASCTFRKHARLSGDRWRMQVLQSSSLYASARVVVSWSSLKLCVLVSTACIAPLSPFASAMLTA
jgi:hypothetical protein